MNDWILILLAQRRIWYIEFPLQINKYVLTRERVLPGSVEDELDIARLL